MQLSVPELKLLIMALPQGLSSEHLTHKERREIRELISRMAEHCNEAERVDEVSDGSGG